MSSIDSMVNLSAIQTMAQVQMAVAAKVMSVQKDEGQMAVELINAALESVQQAASRSVEQAGHSLDVSV